MNTIKYRVIGYAAFAVLLAGCSTHPAINQADTIPIRVDQDLRETEQARKAERRVEYPTATRSREIVRVPRGNAWLRENIGKLSYPDLPLSEALKLVLGKRPYKFQFLNDVQQTNNALVPGAPIALPGNAQFDISEIRPSQIDRAEDFASRRVSSPVDAPTVLQHLESLATQTGLRFSVDNGVVIFSDYELKVFSLASTQVPTRFDPVFNNDEITTGGESGAETIFTRVANVMARLVTSPNIFIADRLTNTVTVAADAMTLQRAERYIAKLNETQKKQVKVRIDFYDVNLSALSERSVDFAISNLASDISSLSGLTTSIATVGGSLESSPNQITFGFDDPSSSLDGANALLRFLRQQESLTTRQSTEFILGNNDTKREVRTQVTPYISQVSQETSSLGVASATTAPSIQTEEANTGTSVQLSASIVEDRVFLNLLIEESRLTVLVPFSFGEEGGDQGGFVAGVLPTTERTESTHRVSLLDGETIAVGAQVISQRQVITQNGSLIPVLGDSVDKNEERIQTLVVITAHIF